MGDHELMDQYIDGDGHAFSRLHARLEHRLRGLLLKLVRDEATAEDLLQLTFLKAHLARERYAVPSGHDPDKAVVGWYFAIARNAAMDHLRREQRWRTASAEPWTTDSIATLPDDRPTPEDEAVEDVRERELVARVREAIAALPETQRRVTELHKLRGMTMAEVAAQLRIREGTARVRAHRAYRTLARTLGAASRTAAA
jgi:RNA polymerase sigma-70 factor (ECF subfamily)